LKKEEDGSLSAPPAAWSRGVTGAESEELLEGEVEREREK